MDRDVTDKKFFALLCEGRAVGELLCPRWPGPGAQSSRGTHKVPEHRSGVGSLPSLAVPFQRPVQ
jgi:hypothetical protein